MEEISFSSCHAVWLVAHAKCLSCFDGSNICGEHEGTVCINLASVGCFNAVSLSCPTPITSQNTGDKEATYVRRELFSPFAPLHG